MKKKTSIAVPILWTVLTVVWTINLYLHVAKKHDEIFLIFNALCIIVGILNTVIQWQRCKRSMNGENTGSENR